MSDMENARFEETYRTPRALLDDLEHLWALGFVDVTVTTIPHDRIKGDGTSHGTPDAPAYFTWHVEAYRRDAQTAVDDMRGMSRKLQRRIG